MQMVRLLVTVCALGATSCTRQDLVDSLVQSAHRPAFVMPAAESEELVLLAGDMHVHVEPPDHPSDVSRSLPRTLTLARQEGLDFVVLTPHVGARFYAEEEQRAYVLASQEQLRRELAALPTGDIVFIPGFEYTDYEYGHVSASFADVASVLSSLPVEDAREHPGRFFELWAEQGGLLVVNHPMVTPIVSIIPMARADLSWRPFTTTGEFPPEIAAVDRLAHGWEVFNLAAVELRDRLLLALPFTTIEATFHKMDERAAATRRRMTPVGGSDSHSDHLRATTFVFAKDKSPAAIHEGISLGRTCVRDPAGCTLQARAPGGAWERVGGAIPRGGAIDVMATGDAIRVFVDGEIVARPSSGEVVRIDTPKGRCSVVRARVDEGFSAPIYVGCFD